MRHLIFIIINIIEKYDNASNYFSSDSALYLLISSSEVIFIHLKACKVEIAIYHGEREETFEC